ncbi:MAG: hypothetical protein L0Y72_03735 [Gemmataceae bacterium]|nr:hypothetical protein [Gemmataceae bacterium]MCI0738130.1 hypothetical protein [Gemmataceae bacterium]
MSNLGRLAAFAIIAFSLVLLPAGPVLGQKKKAMDQTEKATAQDYKALQNVKQFSGKLAFAEPTSKIITVRIESKVAVPIKDDKKKKNIYGKGGTQIVTKGKDFDFEVSDKVVVRKMGLFTEYDDKGNLKQYTSKEIAELRGSDPSKPGYAATYEDLLAGQLVTLHLNPPPKPAPDAGAGNVAKPSVRMIVIVQQSTGTISSAPPKKKK